MHVIVCLSTTGASVAVAALLGVMVVIIVVIVRRHKQRKADDNATLGDADISDGARYADARDVDLRTGTDDMLNQEPTGERTI